MINIENKEIKTITIDKRKNKGPTELTIGSRAVIKINGIDFREFNNGLNILQKNARN